MDRSLPHSVELRAFLMRNNGHADAVEAAISLYDHFCDRWTDESYPVMGKPVDDGLHRAAIEEALDCPSVSIEYISRSKLAMSSDPVEWDKYFDIAARQEFIRSLRDVDAHDRSLSEAASYLLFGRELSEVVSSTLGSRRLQVALDNSFGSSFGRLIKHDILWLWGTYFSHVLLCRTHEAGSLDKLINLERTNPVLGRDKSDPSVWYVWVH